MKKLFLRTLSLTIFSLVLTTSAMAAPAPDMTWRTSDGELNLTQLEGKVVYLDFWASWCGPCRKSFPWMNTLQDKYAEQGLVVIAVNLDKDRELVKQFLAKYPAHFTVAYDPAGESAAAFGVKGMPSSYLIDRNGEIRHSHIGFREKDREALEANIRDVL